MTIDYTLQDTVLDTVAIILILLPEPATTAMGISLLARRRGKNTSGPPEPEHIYHHYPEYHYRVENIRGREITWEVRTFMPGQLPLSKPNKPAVSARPREYSIYALTPAAASSQSTTRKLPPGVKVHHEIYRPSPIPLAGRNVYIPGETIHHTLREVPQGPVVNRRQPAGQIHHTIENSPAYIKAQFAGIPQAKLNIIHHTIQDSPGMQRGNPANIVKPVHIVEHHELNKTQFINVNGRMIRAPSQSARRPQITGRNPDPRSGR